MRSIREAGSAFIVTLLCLVVLTIVGLSLALITQTERQLGVNERTAQRVFYAADSGTHMGTARVLAQNDHNEMTVVLNERQGTLGLRLADRVEVSRFHPILASPCNFCEINQGSQYFDVNHAITSTAERIGWTGGGPPPADASTVARKTVGEMISFQPWQVSLARDVLPSLESTQLEKIKF